MQGEIVGVRSNDSKFYVCGLEGNLFDVIRSVCNLEGGKTFNVSFYILGRAPILCPVLEVGGVGTPQWGAFVGGVSNDSKSYVCGLERTKKHNSNLQTVDLNVGLIGCGMRRNCPQG